MGPFYVWSFNGLFEDMADDFDIGFTPNFTGNVIGETGMSQPDIIHPNRRGVQKMVDNVYADVKNYIIKLQK
jgi:acyl-CoA thioesterase-1